MEALLLRELIGPFEVFAGMLFVGVLAFVAENFVKRVGKGKRKRLGGEGER